MQQLFLNNSDYMVFNYLQFIYTHVFTYSFMFIWLQLNGGGCITIKANCHKRLINNLLDKEKLYLLLLFTMQEWLRDESLNVLERPSQSPNLNPI
jgi:hypothetical protein